MTKFNVGSLPDATNVYNAFRSSGLTSFNTDLPLAIRVDFAWRSCASLTSFGAVDIKNCTNFTSSWQDCSALTSFPAGAKLGTSASNVNFTEAWRESGLTSFNTDLPTGTIFQKTWRQSALTSFGSIDLSSGNSFNSSWQLATSLSSFGAIDARNGTNFQEAWRDCSSLTDFSGDAKLGTAAANVNFTSAWQSSGLTSFPVDIDLSKGINFPNAWRSTALTSFPAIQSTSAGRSFFAAWYECQEMTSFGAANLNASEYFAFSWALCAKLEDFPRLFTNWNPSSIVSGVFNASWDGCSALSAQSVENILTSIDSSGKYATSTGASGGSALGDAGIDIDYNTATGSLSAATTAAVTSLKAKGWSIIVNNVTL